MIEFRTGSHAGRLLNVLSVVSEYPVYSLRLMGNERWYKELVHKLSERQTIVNIESGEKLDCKLINISGKGSGKTIRLTKNALPILRWISPNALPSYLVSTKNHKFSGDASHIERNHRVTEAVAMCMRIGMEFRPYMLPPLQNERITSVIPSDTVFYPSKTLKSVGQLEMNKTMFTRIVGAIFSGNKCFAVYNTRNSVMKWNGMGEFKALHSLIEIARMNAGLSSIDSAILFGQSDRVLLDTLMVNEKNKRLEFRFDGIYRHIHFVPLSETGVRLLKIICLSEVQRSLLDLLFESDSLSNGNSSFEYDTYVDQKYILSHLDGDIARLIRFKEALLLNRFDSEVLCFKFQADYVKKFLAGLANVKIIEMSLIETELGLS